MSQHLYLKIQQITINITPYQFSCHYYFNCKQQFEEKFFCLIMMVVKCYSTYILTTSISNVDEILDKI